MQCDMWRGPAPQRPPPGLPTAQMPKLLRCRLRSISSRSSYPGRCYRPRTMQTSHDPVESHLVSSFPLDRCGISSQAAPPPLRMEKESLSAVIHQLVGAGYYAQAICLTKCHIQQQQQLRRSPACRNLGQELYSALRKTPSSSSSVAAFDVLVVALCGCGLLEEALWVYHQLADAPSANACNALLNALLRAGRISCLWDLYADMLARGREPSAVTFNILLNACRQEGDLSKALNLLDTMASPSVVSFTTVICGLCEEGRLRDAMAVFSRMLLSRAAPNLYTFNALLDGHCRLARLQGALAIFAAILRRGLRPNAVTFGILARGLCHDERAARALFRCMIHHHGVPPNGYVYNALIHGLCQSGKLAEALQLREEMAVAGVRPDAVTCGVLMKAYCDAGRPREAAELLRKFRDVEEPVLYNTLIHGHCRAGDMEEAARVWGEMTERGVEPDEITFSLMIHGHCRRRNLGAAGGAFSEMVMRGRAPDVVTYTSLIDARMKMGEPEEARKLWRDMAEAGVPANAFTACAVVHGLCRLGRSREAMDFLLDSADSGAGFSGVACMALIQGLHADAQEFKAGRVFWLMREAGFVPDAVTYGILLRGQRRKGYRRNAMALRADMLKAGVPTAENDVS